MQEGAVVSDGDLRDAVAAIVATCDLATMTKRTVVAELAGKYGESAVANKGDMIKAVIVDEVAKRQATEAGPEHDEEEPKKRAKEAPPAKKAAAPKKRKDDSGEAVAAPVDDLPTNVEMEVDLSSFRRRNPGRAAKPPEKKRKDPKAKRDPSKPKRPGKIMQLSTPMAEFMGCDEATRTDVAAKVRAHIKEKNLQDPKDGRNIILANDEAMKKLWPTQKKTTFFKLTQLLSKHLFNKGEVVRGDDSGDEDEEGGEGAEEGEREGKEKEKKDGEGVQEVAVALAAE